MNNIGLNINFGFDPRKKQDKTKSSNQKSTGRTYRIETSALRNQPTTSTVRNFQ